MPRSTWCLAVMATALVVVSVSTPRGHTAISSRYTYNEHLFPIFRERCGSCHIDGGVAPFSLVEYEAAYPWTQAIREEVMALRMPPWQAEDGFGDFRNGHVLPAHEMDMILEWSAGGYPQGPRDQVPPVPVLETGWALGEPSLELQMTEPFELDAATNETVRYFVLPSEVSEDRVLAGVDFRPGVRAVVRGAAVFVDDTGIARELDEADPTPGFAESEALGFPTSAPVALFTPGQDQVLNDGVGYAFPADADVVLRVHYRKSWMTQGTPFTDRSAVGLHFAEPGAVSIRSTLVESPATLSGREATFAYELGTDTSVLALFPEVDVESSQLIVEAVRPDGERVPMLWLREPDAGWPTRFWFDAPIALPAGSRLEVTAVLDAGAEHTPRPTLVGETTGPIRLSVDYVDGEVAANN